MSDNNQSFTITDERLEWDGDGEDQIVVQSPDRRRTLMVAGEEALAGGLLGACVTTVVLLSSASGSAAPKPPVHPAPVRPKTTAVVQAPAAVAHHKPQPKVTHPHHEIANNRPVRQTKPASTAHIHFHPKAHHNHRSSK